MKLGLKQQRQQLQQLQPLQQLTTVNRQLPTVNC